MLSFSVILLLFWYHFDEVLSFSAENTRNFFWFMKGTLRKKLLKYNGVEKEN